MERVCVFGLGYVGREVASLAAERGYHVDGIDTDSEVVSELEKKDVFDSDSVQLTTDGNNVVDEADVIIAAVPTPISNSYEVDLSAVEAITETVANADTSRKPLYVVESTVPPGTVRDLVVPVLEDHDLTVGEDIYVAHVPERINPGSGGWSLEKIPRVAGAVTRDGLERTVEFYESLIDADVHAAKSPAVAEASKIVENTYRDINIAYVNEVALALEQLDIDTSAVLDAAETKPFGFTRFSPGAGVGGHCIPIDPYFLIRQADANGFNNRFLKYAREINDMMPQHVAQKTVRKLNDVEVLPNGSRVVLLGKAFKPNVGDTRNSPYYGIKSELESYGVRVETYDPQMPEESTVDSPYVSADAVVVVTAHDEFKSLSFERMSTEGVQVLVDGRNMYDPEEVREAGLGYVGVGR